MEIEKKQLKVPFGFDPAENEVRPDVADRSILYTCPSCHGALVLRSGAKKRQHFAHKTDPNRCDFLNETEEHFRAKERIVELVRERIPIFFNRFCRCCGESGKQQLPVNIVDAVCEHVLPSGHRVDVGLLDERGQLRAVIEVVVFHAVETDKASYLNEFVPWAEFDAVTILGSFCWTPKVDRFKAYICPRCRFVAANSSLLNWVGVGYSFVECPRKNGASVLAVEVCSACDGFVTAAPGGVVCFGEVSLGNEADLR